MYEIEQKHIQHLLIQMTVIFIFRLLHEIDRIGCGIDKMVNITKNNNWNITYLESEYVTLEIKF